MRRAHHWIAMAAALACGMLAPAVQAQDEPETADILEELVVRGRLPGPAWWKVSDADTEVYVLVVPPSAPAGMTWDTGVAQRRIAGARQLILPSEIRGSFLQVLPTAISVARQVRTKTALETTLPPGLRDRFIAAKGETGIGERETKFRAGFAALMLESRYRRVKGLRDREVLNAMIALAKKNKLKIVSPGPSFAAARPAIREALGEAPTAKEEACLAETLNTLQTRAAADRKAALDWAEGDVRGMLAAAKAGRRAACNEGVLTRQLLRLMTNQQVTAIEAALKVPGSAVAIVDVDRLVVVGGVLDTLRSRGFEVKTPAAVD